MHSRPRPARPRPDPLPITIDTREQVPILFPRHLLLPDRSCEIILSRDTAPFADYGVTGRFELAAMERKYRLRELERNMEDWRDKHRARRAFRRFAEGCQNRYLLLDMSISQMLPKGEASASLTVFRVLQVVRGYGFHLLGPVSARSVDVRLRLGTLIALLFASHLWPDDSWNLDAVGHNGWADVLTGAPPTPAPRPKRRRKKQAVTIGQPASPPVWTPQARRPVALFS